MFFECSWVSGKGSPVQQWTVLGVSLLKLAVKTVGNKAPKSSLAESLTTTNWLTVQGRPCR